ncbi:MAG TPA: ribosomal-protein-alanine N-acetyltransferase [Crenotrichaceae bacterium]|nr:ribosomal-protein-alanine N-acetyltransferase [Crenotrichaceae bacterium]
MANWINTMKRMFIYNAERDFYAKHFPEVMEDESLLNLRVLRRIDIDQLIEIEKQVYGFPWSAQTFRDCMKIGYSCWVIEKLGDIVAYGIVSIAAGEAHVMNLCVDPQHQRKGYGRRLMRQLIAVALEERCRLILLEVRPSNEKAIALYHDMGFNEIGRRKDYYPAENGREDALLLGFELIADEADDDYFILNQDIDSEVMA